MEAQRFQKEVTGGNTRPARAPEEVLTWPNCDRGLKNERYPKSMKNATWETKKSQ